MDQVLEPISFNDGHDNFESCRINGGKINELSPYADTFQAFHSLFFRFKDENGGKEFFYVNSAGKEITNPEKNHYWIGYGMHKFRRLGDELDRPWLLINGNAPQIKNVKLNEKYRKQILEKGFGIFYFEPIYLCDEKENWPWIPGRSEKLTMPEFDWLREFLALNEIPADVVKIFVNDYRLANFLKKIDRYTEFEIHTEDVFLHSQVAHLGEQDPLLIHKKFEHRFICLNFRYDCIRELITAYVYEKGRAAITFFHSHDRFIFLSLMPFDPRRQPYWPTLDRGIKKLDRDVPVTIDTDNSRAVSYRENAIPDVDGTSNVRPGDDISKTKLELYRTCFVAIVNESRILTPCPQISEKTLDPILQGRPFVLMAGPRALEYLQGLGFKTFHDFWDESYDQEEDHALRIQKVLKVIDYIDSLSEQEVEEMNQKMIPILEHNRDVLMNRFLPEQANRLSGY